MTLRFFTRPDSVNKRILRAALIVGAVTVIVKVGSTVKDVSVARAFGRSDSLDAFLFAFMLPSFAVTLIVGALSAALVPVLVDARQKEGPDAGRQLLSNVLILTVAGLVAVAILLGLLVPLFLPYLAHSFAPQKIELTRKFVYMLVPWLILSGVSTLIGYVLNSFEKFAAPALVPILSPLAILTSIAFWARPATGTALAVGTVVGSLLEAAWLCSLARQHQLLGDLRWYGMNPRVRAVLAQTGPMMAGCLLMGATPVVDQFMASMLGSGSVAALSYGSKLTMGLLAIGGTALSTATLPYFSRMVAQDDWQGCRHTIRRYSVLVLGVSVPVTAALIVLSKPLIRLLFQRGAFTSADTEIVSGVQALYLLQIPFYVLCMLFVRFISSIRRNDLLMYASAINLTVDIVMNLVLMRVLGVAGIALSTTIVMVGSLTFLSVSSLRLLNRQRAIAVQVVPATVRQ